MIILNWFSTGFSNPGGQFKPFNTISILYVQTNRAETFVKGNTLVSRQIYILSLRLVYLCSEIFHSFNFLSCWIVSCFSLHPWLATAQKDTSFIQSDVSFPASKTRIRKLKPFFRSGQVKWKKIIRCQVNFTMTTTKQQRQSTLYQPRVKETLQ